MSRREQKIGKAGQGVAAGALRRLGVECVEEIGTPVKLTPSRIDPHAFRVVFGEKVSGDHRGLLPGGRSVLAETKTVMEHNLRWSDFRPHQPGCLEAHAENGGVSLVVWVHATGVYVLRWPIPGFGPGKSVDMETAERLRLEVVT